MIYYGPSQELTSYRTVLVEWIVEKTLLTWRQKQLFYLSKTHRFGCWQIYMIDCSTKEIIRAVPGRWSLWWHCWSWALLQETRSCCSLPWKPSYEIRSFQVWLIFHLYFTSETWNIKHKVFYVLKGITLPMFKEKHGNSLTMHSNVAQRLLSSNERKKS